MRRTGENKRLKQNHKYMNRAHVKRRGSQCGWERRISNETMTMILSSGERGWRFCRPKSNTSLEKADV